MQLNASTIMRGLQRGRGLGGVLASFHVWQVGAVHIAGFGGAVNNIKPLQRSMYRETSW